MDCVDEWIPACAGKTACVQKRLPALLDNLMQRLEDEAFADWVKHSDDE